MGRFDDLDLEAKEKAVKKIKDLARLKRFFAKATTPGAKLKLAQRVTQIDEREGAKLLVSVLVSDAPAFFRNAALERLGKTCKRPFDVDLMEDNDKAKAKAKAKQIIAEVQRCVKTYVARTPTPTPAPTPPARSP